MMKTTTIWILKNTQMVIWKTVCTLVIVDEAHRQRRLTEQLEGKVVDLERKIEGLNKMQNSLNSTFKKEDAASAGDGIVYADFRDQYKDDVNMLK